MLGIGGASLSALSHAIGMAPLSALPEEPVDPDPGEYVITHYVDYDNGSDSNDGLTKETAFKHHPWDANATGIAAATVLAPGDAVALRGGVYYPNPIPWMVSGSAEGGHIALVGNQWGERRAILDAGKVVEPRALTEQEGAEYGLANWQDLMLVEDDSIGDQWFDNFVYFCMADDIGGLIMPGQYPKLPKDVVLYDAAYQGPGAYLPAATYTTDPESEHWAEHAEIAARAVGQESAALLGVRQGGEQVSYVPVMEVVGDSMRLHRSPGNPATSDDSTTLIHDRYSVNEPGVCAYLEPGKAVFYPRPGATRVTILQQRSTIPTNHRNYAKLIGLELTGNMNARAVYKPASVTVRSSDWVIQDCVARDMYTMRRSGAGEHRHMAFYLPDTNNVTFTNNAGYRLAAMGLYYFGQNHDLVMRDFIATRIGGSCIAPGSTNTAYADERVHMSRFILSSVRGIHANAISRYGGIEPDKPYLNTTLEDFAIWSCDRAITSQGNDREPPQNGPILIQRGYLDNVWKDYSLNVSSSAVLSNTWSSAPAKLKEVSVLAYGAALQTENNVTTEVEDSYFRRAGGTATTTPEHWVNSSIARLSGLPALRALAEERAPLRESRRIRYCHPTSDPADNNWVELDLRDTVPDDPLGIDG